MMLCVSMDTDYVDIQSNARILLVRGERVSVIAAMTIRGVLVDLQVVRESVILGIYLLSLLPKAIITKPDDV